MTNSGRFKRVAACLVAAITALTIAASGSDSLLRQDKALAVSSEKLEELDKAADEKAAAIKEAQEKLAALEEKQAELDEVITKTDNDISAEEKNQQAIEEQIKTVQETIIALEDSITKLNDRITSLTESIAQKEKDIADKKQEIEQGVKDFKQRIRIMYVAGSESYTDILVGASDFYDMLMKLELVKRVADHDNNQIDKLIAMKEQFEKDEAALEQEKASLEADKAELLSQQEKHEAQKSKLDDLYLKSKVALAQLEIDRQAHLATQEEAAAEQAAFEEDMRKLFEEQEAIKQARADEEERIRKEEEERKRKEEEERRRREEEERKRREEEERKRQQALALMQQQQQQQNTAPTEVPTLPTPATTPPTVTNVKNAQYGYVDKSMFTWPVPGFYHISYGVGWRWGAYHQGIDIWSEGIRGAKICAAAAGTVIRVQNYCPHDWGKNGSCGCGGGYGRYCVIDHGDGYWTLYGHSENIIVTVGQHVEQGDVLGYVGSTGYSTGPHLHFEVRINGVAQNPQLYV